MMVDEVKGDDDTVNNIIIKKKKRVFFLDVNPICYDGSTPSLHSFAHWIFLFFSEVSLTDPVIVVSTTSPHYVSMPNFKPNRPIVLSQ